MVAIVAVLLCTTFACWDNPDDIGLPPIDVDPDPCVDSRVDLWCFHSEAQNKPVDYYDAESDSCALPDHPPFARCGAYDVIHGWSSGYVGNTHLVDHETGEHAATVWWTDVNGYCGGFHFWYGQEITCEFDCYYGAPDPGAGIEQCE